MKKYFIDLLAGLASGLIFFFGVELVFQKSAISLNLFYYLIFVIFFIIYHRLRGFFLKPESNRNLFYLNSLLMFALGFFLPFFTWLILFRIAISRFQLF